MFASTSTNLYDFMVWGDYNQKIQMLTSIILPERWTTRTGTKNGVLKNYLSYTFQKLISENKILTTDEYVIFNTGLFTRKKYDPVFVCGSIKGEVVSFEGFCTPKELIKNGISDFPDRADYFSNPSLLMFDWHYKVNVDYDHILYDEDNRERLPSWVKE